ncbi:dopamine N-acetyltransferase-like, partial [Drosophila serrata]|uniref:dopamine N-acetyltransferase-like n=1 Tax=Drosophila serrata TaxID=7274 RepID=UPI000A1CF9B7
IRIMTKDDYPRVKAFMKDDFLKSEPLCQSSSKPMELEKEKEKEMDDYHLSLIAQSTCLVALEESNGDKLVGFVLAGAQFPEDLEKHRQEAEVMDQNFLGHITFMLSKIEREADIFRRYGISKALYSHITSVAASMRGKGLGSRLASKLMDVGRSKGFPAMVAYCTSFYSARQKEALGMECIHFLVYADYKDDSGHPIFTPAAPHTKARVMFIKL